jgi:WD40 repeat protein
MPDENINNELSLDDIFSRSRKEGDLKRKVIGLPFKFLDSYTREDKNIFFGRDTETDEIFRKFYSGKLLLVYGKSGTGKSSIINCGLISRIPEEDIFAINIRCGKKAYENFVSEIKKYSKSPQDNPLEILEDIFYEYSKPVALIFDQFEEIFILSDEEERQKLASSLNEILKSRLKINIILVIREEYFASLTEFESFIPGLYGNRIRVERMNKTSAKDAIIKPCKACNVGIEDGLADKIIEQLIWQSEGLELTWLQILMDKLYRTAIKNDPENPVIKQEELDRLGRIGNVLSDFLDEQLRSMPHGDMGEALLKTMVSTDGTKKQLIFDEISESLRATGHPLDKNLVEEIIRHFINVRIITDKDEQGYYELRHDAIAARIYERMSAVEKELIEVKAFLDNSYKIYEQRKVLLTENDLKYIALFENKLILSNDLKDFIQTSKKEVQKARLRRRYIAVAATAALMLVLSGFSLWAFIERTNALKQTKLAEEQKNEAIKANKEAESARIMAQDGENKAKENEGKAVEQQKIAEEQRQFALKANREADNSRKQALEEKNKAVENEKLALAAKQDAEKAKNDVIRASSQAQFYLYLFNGKELATKSLTMQENDTLRALLALSAFDLVTYGYQNFSQDQAPLKYDVEILKSLQNAFSLFENDSLAGGEIWAIASTNSKTVYSNKIGQLTVSKFENKNPAKLPLLSTESTITLQVTSMVRALTFDPSSSRLACGTIDGNVILFNNFNSNPTEQKIIYNHNNNRVLHLVFVPGREWLISSSTDKTIRIWDITGQKVIKDLQVNESVQKFVLVDKDHLIFTNSAGQILLWHLDDIDKEPQIIYTGDHQPFQTLAYNPEHKWLAVSSSGTVMIFLILYPDNPGSLKPEQFTLKHKTVITHMDFSPDNNWLVTASSDALMLWDLRDIGTKEVDKFEPIVIENSRQIFSLAFEENSRYLLYDDSKLMHIRPIDIKDIYTRLKLNMGKKKLNDKEWKYYVKGDLVKPDLK